MKLTNDITEWFRSNDLTLNKLKTIWMHFRLKKVGTSQEPVVSISGDEITQTSTTKILGIYIDEKLNWKPHISNLSKKISSAAFAMRTLSKLINLNALKMIYFGYVEAHLRYGIVCWGNSVDAKKIFILQKKIIRIIMHADLRASCKPLFKKLEILTLPGLYLYETLIYAHTKLNNEIQNCNLHSYRTRNKNKFHLTSHNTSCFANSPKYSAICLYNKLPAILKSIKNLPTFKKKLKSVLLSYNFYTIKEFMVTNICCEAIM